MSSTASAEEEIVDFIVSGTTPEAILRFRPSEEASLRLEDLIEREKEGGLSADEKAELELPPCRTPHANGQGEGAPRLLARR